MGWYLEMVLKASMTGKAQPVTIPVMVTTNTSQLAATIVLYLARQEWTAVLAMLGPCHHALPRIVAGCTREQVAFAKFVDLNGTI